MVPVERVKRKSQQVLVGAARWCGGKTSGTNAKAFCKEIQLDVPGSETAIQNNQPKSWWYHLVKPGFWY